MNELYPESLCARVLERAAISRAIKTLTGSPLGVIEVGEFLPRLPYVKLPCRVGFLRWPPHSFSCWSSVGATLADGLIARNSNLLRMAWKFPVRST